MTWCHLDTYYKLYKKWKVYEGSINIGCNEGGAGMNKDDYMVILEGVGERVRAISKLSLDYEGEGGWGLDSRKASYCLGKCEGWAIPNTV
jgi:hypothetical protein